MNNEVEGVERGVASAKKAASESLAFLKSATSVGKPRLDLEPSVVSVMPQRGQGPTVISVNVEIVGSVNSPDELHIYGKVEGNVRATSVTVCEGGSVIGDVVAES